jgi:DNA-binding response OmpR family regulator
LGADEAYLTKPFTREELLQRLREVLDKGISTRS